MYAKNYAENEVKTVGLAKRAHYFSGVAISVFIIGHLFNHSASLLGPDTHIAVMDAFRIVYRQPLAESVLLLAVFIQIFSGGKLVFQTRKNVVNTFERLQLASGVYLAFFLTVHVLAVMSGRFALGLDTNFYFGAAGLNSFPHNLFFIPYYSFAILAFFGHIAAIHSKKMKKSVFGQSPKGQSLAILTFGFLSAMALIFGLTDGFQWFQIPAEYNVLIGK